LANFFDAENVTYLHFPFEVTSHLRGPVLRVSTECLSLAAGNIMLHPTLPVRIFHKCCAWTESGPKNVRGRTQAMLDRSGLTGPEWSECYLI